MTRFIATHSVPFTEEVLIKYAKEEAPGFLENKVTWLRTYCDFANNKHFCEWQAPKKEAIEEIFKRLNIPFDGLYPVRVFDVATAKLEE